MKPQASQAETLSEISKSEAISSDWLHFLRCPFCSADLKFHCIGTDSLGLRYGSLSCRCTRYPVISDIPVIKPRFVPGNDRFLQMLLDLVDNKAFDAVVEVVAVEAFGGLSQQRESSEKSTGGVMRAMARSAKRELAGLRKRALLDHALKRHTTSGERETLLRFLDLFFPESEGVRRTTSQYFAYRHTQPRHLVALSLLELPAAGPGPSLEIAAGFGLITRSIVNSSAGHPVFGTDAMLYPLFAAKRCVAPEAFFVCCDANFPLPFKCKLFSSIACFDGIHYVRNKHGLMDEVKRLSNPEGYRILFGSTRNACIDDKYVGHPLTPRQYGDLLEGVSCRMVSDSSILRAYLRKHGPQLARAPEHEDLESEPLLSMIVSNLPGVLADHGPFRDWPHGRGRLGINPLYMVSPREAGKTACLKRVFPSRSYQADNEMCTTYLPAEIEVDADILQQVRTGTKTPQLEEMIQRFVVIGLPENFGGEEVVRPTDTDCNRVLNEASVNVALAQDRFLPVQRPQAANAEKTGFSGLGRVRKLLPAGITRFVRRRLWNAGGNHRRKIRQLWSIGIFQGDTISGLKPAEGIQNPVLTAAQVSDVPAGFVADPFMLRNGRSWRMFFEVWNRQTRRGEIGLASSADGRDWNYDKIVLAEPFHLSYPYVFEWEDCHYMVPETYETRSVRLYRATGFPYRWEFIDTLLSGRRFKDASLFRHNGCWWMFVETSPNLKCDTLSLYYSTGDLRGPWVEHPQSPLISNNARVARPAGRIVRIAGKLYRFAQECEPIYGLRVHCFEIKEITTETYREEVIEKTLLNGSGTGWNSGGMHHVDLHEADGGMLLACVDGWIDKNEIPLRGGQASPLARTIR